LLLSDELYIRYMVTIFKLDQVDLNNITFDNPINVNQQILVPISYNNLSLFIQVPALYLESIYKDNIMVFSLESRTPNETDLVNNFFSSIDNKIKSELGKITKKIRNQTKNLNKKYTYQNIVYTYYDNNNSVAPNILHKLDKQHKVLRLNTALDNDKKCYTKVYNFKKELLSDINSTNLIGSYMTTIIELNSIVINSDNIITLFIRLHQMKISKPPIKKYIINEYSFVDSDTEENEPNVTVSTATDCVEDSIVDYDLIKSVKKDDDEIREYVLK
jgi:hypothetical protein